MKKILFVLIVCGVAHTVFAQTENASERTLGWRSDIDSLLSLMKHQHYTYRSQPLPAELLARASALQASVPRYSDERMVFELEKLMYFMHDGHSYVLPFASKRGQSFYLPLQFYLFSDGVYIIDANEPYTRLIGSRVTHINGIRVGKIVKDMNSYVHQDNAYTVKWFAPTVMRFRGVYEMYGLPALSKNVRIGLVDRTHRSSLHTIEFVPVASLRGIPKLIPSRLHGAPPVPAYLSDVKNNFWLENIPERHMLYFQFNQVENARTESLAEFSVKLDSALSQAQPRLFVIDVRHNNGGNKMLLRPLVDVIKKFEAAHTAAKIIVITGRNTFSAAQVFIALMDKETKALFAGEPSASSPNFVGEEGNMFVLPWSGAMGNISTRYHETIPGDTRKWIQPDFLIPLSSQAYFANRDPVMEFIRRKFAH